MNPVAPAPEPSRSSRYPAKWRAFGAIALAYITIVLSTSMAFLLLPAIAEDFDVTLRAVGWVVIVESLIVSALLLPMGSVADAFGRRRVLLAGMTIFGAGTLLTGFATTFTFLIVARVVMAFGNALVQSVGTGLVVTAFPPEERGLALGAQTTAVSVGAASGPLLAGLGLKVFAWDTLFLLIAIPTAASVLAIRFLLEDDASDELVDRPPFDRVGSALSALVVTLIVVIVTNPFDLLWLSPTVAAGTATAAALLFGFVRWELQAQRPMLELRLFRLPTFRIAVAIRVLGFVSSTTSTLLLPVYLLSLRGISSVRAGVILFLMALGMGLSAQVSGRMYDRVGPRVPSIVGLLMLIAADVALAMAVEDTSLIIIGLYSLVIGVSVGLWNVPNNSAMLGAMPVESLGVGGAFTNVTRTIGNVFGQAVAAGVVVAVMASQGFDIPLGEIDETVGAGDVFIDGWRAAFIAAALIALFTLVLSLRLPGQTRRADHTRSVQGRRAGA